jgi:hypothetical protein
VAALQFILVVLLSVSASGLAIALCGWGLARLARPYTDSLQHLVLSLLSGNSVLFTLEAVGFMAGAPRVLIDGAAVAVLLLSAALFLADVTQGRIRPWEFAPGLLAWLGLSFFILAGASLLVVQGVPGTFWDWWEHYLRGQIFFQHRPARTPMGGWSLASRGPMFNGVAALLMQGLGEPTYWKFLIVAVVLNAQVVLPLALLLRQLSGFSERAALATATAVLLFLPYFNWNLTFTWPKLTTTAWILTALSLALAGVRAREARLVGWGVFAMAPAFLNHFLAFLYAALLLPWLLYYARTRHLAARPLLIAAGLGLALSGGWMMFLVTQFGWNGVVLANSTIGTPFDGWPAQLNGKVTRRPGGLELIGWNFASTVTPVCLREQPLFANTFLEAPVREEVHLQPDAVETRPAADHGQVFRLGSLEPAVGWTGLVLLAAAAGAWVCRALRRRAGREFAAFWLFLVIVGVPVTFWPVRWYTITGTLTNNFQPYVCLAAVLVAGWLATLSPRWRIGLIAAWLLECGVRTAFILWFQTRPIPYDEAARGTASTLVVDHDYLSNYLLKTRNHVLMPRDLVPAARDQAIVALALVALGLLCFLLAAAVLRRTMTPVAPLAKG